MAWGPLFCQLGVHAQEINLRGELLPEVAPRPARGWGVPLLFPSLFSILSPPEEQADAALNPMPRGEVQFRARAQRTSARSSSPPCARDISRASRFCHTLAGLVAADLVGSVPRVPALVPGATFLLSPAKQPEPCAHSLLWQAGTLDPAGISPTRSGVNLGLCQFRSTESRLASGPGPQCAVLLVTWATSTLDPDLAPIP